jgi:hypothetical protein
MRAVQEKLTSVKSKVRQEQQEENSSARRTVEIQDWTQSSTLAAKFWNKKIRHDEFHCVCVKITSTIKLSISAENKKANRNLIAMTISISPFHSGRSKVLTPDPRSCFIFLFLTQSSASGFVCLMLIISPNECLCCGLYFCLLLRWACKQSKGRERKYQGCAWERAHGTAYAERESEAA